MENEYRLSKRKIITAIVSVCLVAMLGAGWFLIKDKAPEEIAEKSGITELLTVKLSDIKSVTVKNDEGEMTVSQNEGKLSVSPENEELTQDILKYYLEGYTNIYATVKVKGAEGDLTEYGIKENENYFEIALSDNSTHRFCIGESAQEGYYCLRAEDKTLWIVPKAMGAALIRHPEIKKENADSLSVAIDYENIYYAGLSKGGETVFKIRRVSDSTAIPYNFYSTYEITEPFSDIAYTTELTNFLKNLATPVSPIGHMGLASENSGKYGIDKGYTLTVKDSQKTHLLRFGNRSEAGVYMTYNDYPYVYLVADSLLNILEQANPNDFATPYIDLYMVDDVSGIIIKSGENENTLTIDNANEKYLLNGAKMEKAEFNQVFDALTDITVYKGVEENLKKGNKVCEITYTLKNGTEYTREYYDCQSAMVYITQKESGVTVTVKKSAVDKAIKLSS